MLERIADWLSDGTHWRGPDGIPTRMYEHLQISLVALVLAAAIALPLGIAIGHSGKGRFAVAGTSNALRALPSFGLLILFFQLVAPRIHGGGDLVYVVPTVIVLVILAVPPILSNTYAGIQNVDPAVRDAARGMGMTPTQVAMRVEVPCALPLIVSGLRSALLQVIATATLGAFIALGGLGRYILDGKDTADYPMMASGAILVALLALVADRVFALVQWLVVSPGVSGKQRTHKEND